ncbi:MAG: aminotransferase class V-fold PLP-dependent enzyme [Candidatus Latescibacteria bacterium]|nr:aminotransferase class V-fold PLP-dependent enzyme [Candidatus Latescibacterota bacterium]
MNIKEIRRDFPALKNYTWFQNGGVSITPAPVAREHARRLEELSERGPMHLIYPEEEYPRRRRSMERLARFFSVAAGELALMRGVSEAFQTVLRGLPWKAGDRLVISADEEAALLLAALHVRDRHGVEVVKVPLIDDAQGQLAAFEKAVNGRTRLVAFSHVTTDLGFRLPAAAICRLARQRGALSFVDLAHSAGLYPMPLDDLCCDFAGLLSYKWMYSPYAAGALFVRRASLDKLAVTYAGGRSEAWLDFAADQYGLRDTAERFQYGPWSWPLVHAWARALDYLDDIGLEAIWGRTVDLSRRLKEGLESIPGSRLYTPRSSDCSAALVSFGLAGWTGAELSAILRRRWNTIIKPLPHGQEGLRASMAFFLLEGEVDALLQALAILSNEK